MARSEARIYVDIWEDPDFLDLSPLTQRMFMFLVSQKDLAHTGVIALRERRWARGSRGLTVEEVRKSLIELAARRFVVLDEDAEELLIRSFIRSDKVYRQPNVLRAAADHLPLISSPAIREELLAELRRILAECPYPEGSAEPLGQMVATLEKACRTGTPNPSRKGSDIPSADPTEHLPGDRGVVTVVPPVFPGPLSSDSGPQELFSADASVKSSTATKRGSEPVGFAEWYAAYPRRDGRVDAVKAYPEAVRKRGRDRLLDDARRYAVFVKPRERGHILLPATFLRGERWNDDMTPPRPSSGTGDQPYRNPTDPNAYDEYLKGPKR